MTTEEKELLHSVRADMLNLGASFNKLIEALVPITEIIQRQEAKIDSNAAAVELMLRELAKTQGLISEGFGEEMEAGNRGHKNVIDAINNVVRNQLTDNKNVSAIWNVVSTTDKKVDESFKSILSKIGSLNATLDNQWANR
ncbi:MAG: hypothetical protein IBX43_06580 [Campylobacterales bacterium]|nr:hypothetical protein [Campylobacterales bacterium]